jgi:cob(I)alamin adenosyltransferase
MSLYTKTGDEGETGLFGNRRVPKDDLRIEAYGSVDELNSLLGLLRCEPMDAATDERLCTMQSLLFEIGADLATDGGQASVPAVERAILDLECWIDESERQLPQLRSFILPGGSRLAAMLHVARTESRRAERRFWTLAKVVHDVPRPIGVLLNRMSDLFFSWARLANLRAGVADVPWQRQQG